MASRTVVTKLTGHKTEAVYRRAAIVTKSDLREAGTKIAAAPGQATSQAVFGRDIKHILLLHIGAFDAAALDVLIGPYRRTGVRMVGLKAAMADPSTLSIRASSGNASCLSRFRWPARAA